MSCLNEIEFEVLFREPLWHTVVTEDTPLWHTVVAEDNDTLAVVQQWTTFSDLLLTYTELVWLFVLKISVLDDIQEPNHCDVAQNGYDSPALLNHTCSAGENSLNDSSLLEEVDLHGNCLTSLPYWLFIRFPFLCRVDASQNQLEHLPLEVWACSSLVELTLFRNRLSSLTCGQVERFHLQLEGDVDQRPGTPASCNSEGSLPSDVVTSLSTTDPEHRDVTVRHLERWRDRVEVRRVSYIFSGTSERSSQMEHRKSGLKELDLSHNEFEEVPSILPCVAPSLERLNLSYNRLTRFGPVDCYPASLRLLDLSHNRISTMDLTEDCPSNTSKMTTPVSIPTPSLFSSSLRPCCSPFLSKRSVLITSLSDLMLYVS